LERHAHSDRQQIGVPINAKKNYLVYENVFEK
jgi:hypothetical protein